MTITWTRGTLTVNGVSITIPDVATAERLEAALGQMAVDWRCEGAEPPTDGEWQRQADAAHARGEWVDYTQVDGPVSF